MATACVPIDPSVVPVLDMLIEECNRRRAALQESENRAAEAAARIARQAGLKPEDYNLDWNTKSFVPKKRDQ